MVPNNVKQMSEADLFDALREQVNKSRFSPGGHDRKLTREISEELSSRGLGLRKHSQPKEAET